MEKSEIVTESLKTIGAEKEDELIFAWKDFLETFEEIGVKLITEGVCTLSIHDFTRLVLSSMEDLQKEHQFSDRFDIRIKALKQNNILIEKNLKKRTRKKKQNVRADKP